MRPLLILILAAVIVVNNVWPLYYVAVTVWDWLADLHHIHLLLVLLVLVIFIRRWWRMTEGA
jgi:hypothetical protein